MHSTFKVLCICRQAAAIRTNSGPFHDDSGSNHSLQKVKKYEPNRKPPLLKARIYQKIIVLKNTSRIAIIDYGALTIGHLQTKTKLPLQQHCPYILVKKNELFKNVFFYAKNIL